MPSATDRARLVPLRRGPLPAWCESLLAPPGGAFFAGRAWYDTVLTHAVPPEGEPVLAVYGAETGDAGAVAVPLLSQGRRLRALTTPYTLGWHPLVAPNADAASLHAAGRALATLLRRRAPTCLDALDEESPALGHLMLGFRDAGIVAARYRHFGNWHEVLPPDTTWDTYLAARPPELRTTIGRKLRRAARESRIAVVAEPGPALEEGIAAFHAVRARSWKPHEPFPAFDAALMRAAAPTGALRLGILRASSDDRPLAAQYWLVSGGRAYLPKLFHDEAMRAASPGTALTAAMIRSLIESDHVTELDLGRGDDPYKRLWVSTRRQRDGVVLTDPWHPAGLLELARQAAAQVRRRLSGFLRPAGSPA